MKRVGILTSGGDCQGLNATIRAVAKTLYNQLGNDVEIIGIIDGYRAYLRRNKKDETREFFGYSHNGRYDSRHIKTAVQAYACC